MTWAARRLQGGGVAAGPARRVDAPASRAGGGGRPGVNGCRAGRVIEDRAGEGDLRGEADPRGGRSSGGGGHPSPGD